ncbi:MAG: adenylate/guanylate cyclase domain-containing protein, partial [Candidatus Caldatribacteriota bacterium]|nr:adenylate/guanylate cyclase domain-containing protein [Candidatus Caldatribacteriota bacterium]
MEKEKMEEKKQNNILELFKPYVPEAVTSRILEGKGSLPSERSEATIIFIDIKGFTKLADQLDPEKATEIINNIFEPIVDIIDKFGGSINKFLGDGLMAIFGTPYSHEDDPERAARASLEIMKSIEENGKIKIGKKVNNLKARIGINTGLCISGEIGSTSRKEFTVIGDTVNMASRLQTNATPGKILVGEKTFQRIKDNFIISSPLKLKIKGKKDLVSAYTLKGEKKRINLFEQKKKYYSPFIGREKELQILKEALKSSYQSKGQTIEISGELGIGKSRLILELTNGSLAEEFNILSANCSSWEESKPYAPLKEIFTKIFEIKFDDELKEIDRKIENKIKEIDPSLLFASSYFSRLLSSRTKSLEEIMEQSKEESNLFIRVVKKLLWSFSSQKPLLVIVEDVQWIDDASAEFLFQCSKEIKEYPILLIYSLRESLKKRESIAGAKRIKLSPLKNTESDKLIKSLIKENDIYQLMKDRIISTANGNPLFIEEIVRGIEEKRLSADKDRLGNYIEMFTDFQIPDTVQSIARARIDLLPVGLKEILYQASVLGRYIEIKLLQKITNLEDKVLLETLKKLQKHKFIEEVEAVPKPQSYFAFTHSLIQEIAYNSLLFKARRGLHRKIGAAMEEIYLSKIDAKVEELAYHFKNSDDPEKAVFYLNKAGDKAQFVYAFKNAVNYYTDSIKILKSTELKKEQLVKLSEIYNKLAFSQSIIGGRKEAEINLNKALKCCKKTGDEDNESLILMGMGNLYGDMGQWDKAIEYFKNCLSITGRISNLKRKASVLKGIGLACLFKGDTSIGYSYLKESIDICKEIKALDVYAMALNNIGIYYDMLGKWEKAIEAYKESLSIAKKNNNIIIISNIMNNIGFAYSSLGESKQAIYYLRESVKIADKIGDIYNKGINYIHLGEEYLEKDEYKEVKYYIFQAEKIFEELEDKLGLADVYKIKAKLY